MATICEPPPEDHFVERVYRYPVVTDTCGKVFDYYSWAKSKNSVVKRGLEYAEYTVQTAYTKAQPVIRSLDGQITSLDKFSCRQLDKLERNYPIICEPTDQVVEKTKDFYETGVKPRVSGLVGPVLKPVSTITNGVSTVTRYGLATVSTLSNTRPGRVALSRLNDALDLADRSLDRYLPSDGESESPPRLSTRASAVPARRGEEVRPAAVASRAACLTTKVRRRMYSRAMKDLKQLKLRSDEAIRRMTHSVDLIAYARVHLDATKDYSDQLTSEWRNTMLELEENEGKEEEEEEGLPEEIDEAEANPEPVVHRDRMLASARFWSHRLRLATTAAGLVGYRHLPENLRLKVDEASVAANNLYSQLHAHDRVQELQHSFAESARKAIFTINEHLNAAFDYLATTPLLNWLDTAPTESSSDHGETSVWQAVKMLFALPLSGFFTLSHIILYFIPTSLIPSRSPSLNAPCNKNLSNLIDAQCDHASDTDSDVDDEHEENDEHLSDTSSLTISSEDLWECVQLAHENNASSNMNGNGFAQDPLNTDSLTPCDQERPSGLAVDLSIMNRTHDFADGCQTCDTPFPHRTPSPRIYQSNSTLTCEKKTCLEEKGEREAHTKSICSEDSRNVAPMSSSSEQKVEVTATVDNASLDAPESVQTEDYPGAQLDLEQVLSLSFDSTFRRRGQTQTLSHSVVQPISGFLGGGFQQLRRYHSENLTIMEEEKGVHSQNQSYEDTKAFASSDLDIHSSKSSSLKFCVSLMTDPDL